ncbi:MAG: NAD(P)-dependent alcohol dehydrogenase [Leptospiraceae bacterium]|nr:NAD(P)-dependent alcohol dehydrogenase [Leptospiraceae bacterium]
MRCYEIHQFTPDLTANMRLTERPDPVPDAHDVLVRMRAASLNFRDYLTIVGEYNPRYRLPLIPLSDGAGEVVAVGAAVSEFKPGDRVVGLFAPDWQAGEGTVSMLRNTLGGPQDGTLSELRNFPEHGLLKIPDWMSFTEAASLPCAALTAWSALFTQGNLQSGDTILLLGTGGVSIAALQFARTAGARIIITSSSDAKLERARELGAHETINYVDRPNWSREVRKVTGMRGVDMVIEVGGAGTLEHSLKSVRPFGQVSLIGILAGREEPVNLIPILMQNVRVQGVIVGHRQSFEQMLRAIDMHSIRPVIDRVFPFEESAEALAYLRDGKHFGKICIEFN